MSLSKTLRQLNRQAGEAVAAELDELGEFKREFAPLVEQAEALLAELPAAIGKAIRTVEAVRRVDWQRLGGMPQSVSEPMKLIGDLSQVPESIRLGLDRLANLTLGELRNGPSGHAHARLGIRSLVSPGNVVGELEHQSRLLEAAVERYAEGVMNRKAAPTVAAHIEIESQEEN